MNEERLDVFLRQGDLCNIFYIDKNDKWCLRRGYYKDIPLDSFPEEDLDDLLDEMKYEDIRYNTIVNIDTIRKEYIENRRV